MSSSSVAGMAALVTLSGGTASAHFDDQTYHAPLMAASVSQVNNRTQRPDERNMWLFSNSNYGYCDAKKVAHVWNTGVGSAKAIIGSKIAAGLTNLVDIDIAGTHLDVECSHEEVGLTYSDAVALAHHWALESSWEAKLAVDRLATRLGHKRFWEEYGFTLHEANSITIITSENSDADSYNHFVLSDYGYCDAMKLAQVWNIETSQAKLAIGRKVQGGMTERIDLDIASTANSVSCSWGETSLTLNDATALASFWGVPIGDAKQKAANYASRWGTKGLRQRLADVLPERP